MSSLEDRTVKALGESVMERLRSLRFCIVGCGGTGGNFAEILVRTGARHLALIDGGEVEEPHLNRVLSLYLSDVEKRKVEVLEKRLKGIQEDLRITTYTDHFRERGADLPGDYSNQNVRDAVCDSDVVFIGTDSNESRIAIIDLCRVERKEFLTCGIEIDREDGRYGFECRWRPSPPRDRPEGEGYGPDNASFASIVLEATSIAFTMLLSHLLSEDSEFNYYRRWYDENLRPIVQDPLENPVAVDDGVGALREAGVSADEFPVDETDEVTI